MQAPHAAWQQTVNLKTPHILSDLHLFWPSSKELEKSKQEGVLAPAALKHLPKQDKRGVKCQGPLKKGCSQSTTGHQSAMVLRPLEPCGLAINVICPAHQTPITEKKRRTSKTGIWGEQERISPCAEWGSRCMISAFRSTLLLRGEGTTEFPFQRLEISKPKLANKQR